MLKWLRINGHNLGVLTGQDRRALLAIGCCWELYAVGDDAGMRGALAAVRVLLPSLQVKCHPFARELIAYVLDWGDRDRLWALVSASVPDGPERLLTGSA